MENSNAFAAILAVILVSVISLVGVISLFLSKNLIKRITFILISLAAGTLIGNVFFHLIPEIFEHSHDESNPGIFIVLGILLFFALEKFLHWQHCHDDESHEHKHVMGINNLFADGLHNFIDGVIIAASFSVSTEIGILTTIGVALHEIPQEIGDFGILIHSGYSRTKALLFNFCSALLAVFGAISFLLVGNIIEDFEIIILGITAGGFLYIAIADILPEIKHHVSLKRSFLQVTFLLLGLITIFLINVTLPHSEDAHGKDEEYHLEEYEDEHEDEAEEYHDEESEKADKVE